MLACVRRLTLRASCSHCWTADASCWGTGFICLMATSRPGAGQMPARPVPVPLPQQSLELKNGRYGFSWGLRLAKYLGEVWHVQRARPAETLEAPPRNGRRTMRMLSAKA
jgi:hypothetical protein